MAKYIIKQIIITLLLCLAIILILAVLLYAYVPNNKIIPEQITYVAPEEAKTVLDEAVEDSQVIMTYEVKATDLRDAVKAKRYTPGKVNPFAPAVDNTKKGTDGTSNNSGTNNNNNNNSNNNNNNDTNSGTTNDDSTSDEGKYFENTGTK